MPASSAGESAHLTPRCAPPAHWPAAHRRPSPAHTAPGGPAPAHQGRPLGNAAVVVCMGCQQVAEHAPSCALAAVVTKQGTTALCLLNLHQVQAGCPDAPAAPAAAPRSPSPTAQTAATVWQLQTDYEQEIVGSRSSGVCATMQGSAAVACTYCLCPACSPRLRCSCRNTLPGPT